MKIGIIGMGYVGIATAIAFALKGHEVSCTDIDYKKREMFRDGKLPFKDRELEDTLGQMHSDRPKVFDSPRDFLHECDASFICVGTPVMDGRMSMEFVKSASESIGKSLRNRKGYHVVVVKSTVLPGTTENLVRRTIGRLSQKDWDVAANPEFLREGTALSDSLNPERIVLGVSTRDAEDMLRKIYSPFPGKIIVTSIKTAELIKLASNAFLSLKISFANEISLLCERIGVDVKDVMSGVGADSRIGEKFLNAGMGFGGPCLPKDLDALIHYSEDVGINAKLLKSVRDVNEGMIEHVIEMLREEIGDISGRKIAVFGLAFKEGVNDIRGSRALPLIEKLIEMKAEVYVHDPHAIPHEGSVLGAHACKNMDECIKDAHAIIIQTAWEEYKKMDLGRIKSKMKNALIIDGRSALNREHVMKEGFKYRRIGLGSRR